MPNMLWGCKHCEDTYASEKEAADCEMSHRLPLTVLEQLYRDGEIIPYSVILGDLSGQRIKLSFDELMGPEDDADYDIDYEDQPVSVSVPGKRTSFLDEGTIETICSFINEGLDNKEIAKATEVREMTVHNIRRGHSYLTLARKYLNNHHKDLMDTYLSTTHRRKLNFTEVKDICWALNAGESVHSIATRYGTSTETIKNIIRKKTHVALSDKHLKVGFPKRIDLSAGLTAEQIIQVQFNCKPYSSLGFKHFAGEFGVPEGLIQRAYLVGQDKSKESQLSLGIENASKK